MVTWHGALVVPRSSVLYVLLVYSSVLRTMLLVVVDMLRRITVYKV